MAYMEWTTDLAVGIGEFDEQHKRLIAILNEMHQAMQEGRGKDVLCDVLDRMADYTEYHFSSEETYFDQYGYPQSSQHKKEHENLMKRVHDLQEKARGPAFLLSVEVLEFLKNWIQGHIRGSDQRYTDFFRQKGLA